MLYPNGTVADYEWDAADRLLRLQTTDAGGTVAFTEFSYLYDRVGNRLTMSEPVGDTGYQYDNLYRLIRVDYPDGSWTAYSYDPAGNRVSKSDSA